MNIVADEGVGGAIVRRLMSDGHSVTWIAEVSPGLPDDLVIAAAHDAHALLVTYDKDFGELVVRRGASQKRDLDLIAGRELGCKEIQEGRLKCAASDSA